MLNIYNRRINIFKYNSIQLSGLINYIKNDLTENKVAALENFAIFKGGKHLC